MRRHPFILIVAAVLLFTQEMVAQPINSAQALKNAQAFLQAKGISVESRSMRRAPLAKDNGDIAPYYVFNLGDNEGFVIASGDDRAYPVLAYSDKGCLRTDNLPDNVRYWLDFYKAQIKALKDTKMAVTKPRRAPATVVEPMLTTKWGQGNPYNLSCPISKDGRKCVTGCVATAMAQVMYYHRRHSIRQVMEDIPGYHSELVDDVTVDSIPKGSVIDWDKMKDEYIGNNHTEEQAMAVANLMLYCGSSVGMQYGKEESLVMINAIPEALVRYFDYDDALPTTG